jgi:adenylate cyclase
MAIEIERKFLVDREKLPLLQNGIVMKQGYIKTADLNTVRIRIQNNQAFLTLKSSNTGSSRFEFEYPIPINDAEEMLENLCQRPFIDKKRYLIPYEGHTWEVDIFEGENKGLVVAEIELSTEKETFSLPPWITLEVTTDKRYANSNLIAYPYSKWDQ